MNLDGIKAGRRYRRDMGDLDALAASITERGLLQPVAVRPDGTLVAGARRLAAVKQLGWDDVPVHVVHTLDELLPLLQAERDENVCRKDYLISEKLELAAAIEELERQAAKEREESGHNQHTESCGKLPQGSTGKTRDKVGEAIGMSGRTYEKAREVMAAAEAEPEKLASLLEDMDRTGKVNGVHRRLKTLQAAEALAAEPAPLPRGPFHVLVVDPPWAYDSRAEDDSHRAANPYPSMSAEQFQQEWAPKLRSLAHDDAFLWLWVTNAHLPHAFGIVAAAGFTYKTMLTWAKNRMGTGDWLRGQTEHCLLAVRGSPPRVLTNQTTLLHGPLRQHSRKPEEFYALVEALCPGSKLELFAREKRKGWVQHGNEAV